MTSSLPRRRAAGELDDQSFRTADVAEPIEALGILNLADRVKAFGLPGVALDQLSALSLPPKAIDEPTIAAGFVVGETKGMKARVLAT
jgi:hypothetical protein